MSVLPIGMSGEEGSYQIERSVRFNSSDSSYFSRTPASAGNRKTWTWSGWVKKTVNTTTTPPPRILGAGTAATGETGITLSGDSIEVYRYASAYTFQLVTTAKFRDNSAWYHLVVSYDTSEATSSNRVKIYVNGVQQTSFSTANYPPTLNAEYEVNNTVAHRIGHINGGGASDYLNGYLAEVHFIDGSALTPSSFGETDSDTGVWKPKAYSGSYGTNGFYLDFGDNSSTTALGYDAAGSNDWTPNNFSVTAGAGNDSLVDSPTRYGTDTGVGGEVRGNYCTMNGVDSTNITLSNGNLTGTQATSWQGNTGTFLMTSGKWYWEITADDVYNTGLGVIIPNSALHNQMRTANSGWVGAADGGFGIIYNGSGSSAIWYSNYYTSYSISNYLTSASNGDILQVAFDADSGKIWIGKNNTWGNNGSGAGNPANGTNPGDTLTATELSRGLLPFFSYESGQLTLNAGQRPFAYTAPSGFKALCTTNLPEPTIVDGSAYFNSVLYTGNGSTLAVTGVGFQPDFVWAKLRSQAGSHSFADVIRGGTKVLRSDLTDAEATRSNHIQSFDSDGFTLGPDGTSNLSGRTYVAWNWKANGAGVLNEVGTIDSTVSANTTAGFSVVTYTGTGSNATVGHGLGVAPSMVIVKSRSLGTENWPVYHSGMNASPATGRLLLNLTNAFATNTAMWNSTAPTSTVFSIGTDSQTNTSSATYVAYCFAPIAGYSAFGSYVGNGSTDGPFIFTNHRPAFVMIKRTDAAENWVMYDFARDSYNLAGRRLLPNGSNAEAADTEGLDLISNGFKVRGTSSLFNTNGGTYIYMSLASNPFKLSLAR